jgi:hypothetical protein
MEEQRAVLDRIEDGTFAVLLVGDGEEEHIVPADQLPAGVAPGAWLRVRFEGDSLQWAEVDAAETEQARARIAEKLERLRQRGRRRSSG